MRPNCAEPVIPAPCELIPPHLGKQMRLVFPATCVRHCELLVNTVVFIQLRFPAVFGPPGGPDTELLHSDASRMLYTAYWGGKFPDWRLNPNQGLRDQPHDHRVAKSTVVVVLWPLAGPACNVPPSTPCRDVSLGQYPTPPTSISVPNCLSNC